ncbi:MAG: WbuC family cupin fold metalloprotein [Parabacteroides sp.]|nr:WbuC family cupin fold metalloprotein [Parabacteroides sp.]
MNFDLRTSAGDQSQRMLNALEPETEVPVHRHTETAETVICIEGCLDVVLYEEVAAEEGKFTEVSRVPLCPREGRYGVQIPLGVWHSVEVKEVSTIFEAKDGAYVAQAR